MNGDGDDTSARAVIIFFIPKKKSLTTNLDPLKTHQNHLFNNIKHAAALRAVYAFTRK